jgi:hypothetical protein
MDFVSHLLSQQVGRTVLDRTGLTAHRKGRSIWSLSTISRNPRQTSKADAPNALNPARTASSLKKASSDDPACTSLHFVTSVTASQGAQCVEKAERPSQTADR